MIIYMGPAPTDIEPGLVITDDPCPDCGWPETIVKMWPEDNSISKGCAGCEREEWVDPSPLSPNIDPDRSPE